MYEALDLYFNTLGDLDLSLDGDLKDTRDDDYRSLRQEIITRAQSSYQDWALQPTLGANLGRMVGANNNADTAEQIKNQLAQSLSTDLLTRGNFTIEAIPLSLDSLGLLVAVDTQGQGLEQDVVVTPAIFSLGAGSLISGL